MGCNCGKGRQPNGVTVKPAPSKGRTPPAPASNGNRPIRTDADAAKGTTQTFSLQTSDGTMLDYGSRLERDAALIRNGGTPR